MDREHTTLTIPSTYTSIIMSENDMKVVEVCRVSPPQESPSSAATPTSLPLTFFDIRWLRFPPLECAFFYEYPHPPSSFFNSVLPKLKQSLSLTLQHFLPLAGTLSWPHHSDHPSVHYVAGDSVSLTVAQTHLNFHHLSNPNTLQDASKFNLFIPHLSSSHEKASVLALQLTLFSDSGFCIGITTHHAVMDGRSIIAFIKLWAYFCSQIINVEESSSDSFIVPEGLVPYYDRTVIKDPNGIYEEYVKEILNEGESGNNNRSLMCWNWDHQIPSEAVRGTFELTPSHIKKLKLYTQSKLKNKKAHVSTFAVTFSYLGRCLVKAENTKAENVVLAFAVDCRGRLEPPISASYFGNCVVGEIAMVETEKLLGNEGLVSAMEAMSEGMSRLEMGLVRGVDSWGSSLITPNENYRILSVSGSPRFEAYSVDFGWGRPVKVDIVSIDKTKAIFISESRNGDGGVEIGLVLNKQEMEAFADVFVKDLESFGE